MLNLKNLHQWNITPREAVTLQRELAGSVMQVPVDTTEIDLVAGCDVSSTKFDSILTAGVVVWSRKTGQIVETAQLQTEAPMPYIPGLLSFREAPVLLGALSMLQCTPDAVMVDGHGIAHPRRVGIGAHIGLFLDIPTIGVAKSRLVGEYIEPDETAGSTSFLMHHEEIIGTVLRTKDKVKPVFISPGNNIDLPSAVDLALHCLHGYRLPEPTRLAHLHVNAVRTGKIAGQSMLLSAPTLPG